MGRCFRFGVACVLLAACDDGGSSGTMAFEPDDSGMPGDQVDSGGVGDAGDGADAADAGMEPDGGSGPLDQGVPDPPETPLAPNELRIESKTVLQTMDGIGVNAYGFPFVPGSDVNGELWDAEAIRDQVGTLDIAYVRLVPWTEWWEPINDNEDPSRIDWSNLMNNPDGFDIRSAEWFELPALQWFSNLNIPMFAGVWHGPQWLREEVAGGRYAELAESLVSYFQYLRTGVLADSEITPQGVPLEVLEIQNEPDLDAYLGFPTPEALRDAALATLDRLDAEGLSDVQVHGPNIAQIRTSTTELPFTAAEWIRPWLEEPRLRSRTAAVSYHTWWSDDPADYASVRDLARQYEKPVWATEVGLCAVDEDFCAYLDYSRLDEELWGSTLDFVEAAYRAIVWSDATRVYMWSLAGSDGALRADGSTTAHYAGLRHLANYIPAQSIHVAVRRGSALNSEHPRALAFLQPNGDQSLILLNRGTRTTTVAIRGPFGQGLRIKVGSQSTEQRAFRWFRPNLTEVSLPPRSLTSLILD